MEPILVPVQQEIPGLAGFIGCWLCGREPNMITDVGPACSVQSLAEALSELKVERVDLVLLSHIHLDHAGGLAEFLDRFPMAKVICHSRGIRHLVDPARLWEASLRTLGDMARIYGTVRPVSEQSFIPHTRAAVQGLRVFETPGHAAHHLSFVYQGNLLVGEAAGVYYRRGDWDYLRAATPPPFFMQETLNSIDRLHDLEDQPICFAHAAGNPSSRIMLERARDQVLRWKAILEGGLSRGLDAVSCTQELLERDPELKNFQRMGIEEQERERFFLVSSVKGFLEYLVEKQ